MVDNKDAHPERLAAAITAAAALKSCIRCGFLSTEEVCEICTDTSRAGQEICVVERASDILPIERTGLFRGLYHSLGGRLAPLDHVGPDQLRIPELVDRIRAESPKEIILALSADVEGEATTSYLAQIIEPLKVPVTRIAHGLPAGGGLEHADALTLQRAFAGRNALRV